MKFKKQKYFPYLAFYQVKFPITDETVFPFKDTIYTNYELPPDIYAHEVVHISQQQEIGADKWENQYLKDPRFRLSQELPAYRVQLRMVNSLVKDKNQRNEARVKCALALSGDLYGGLVTYAEAFKMLQV